MTVNNFLEGKRIPDEDIGHLKGKKRRELLVPNSSRASDTLFDKVYRHNRQRAQRTNQSAATHWPLHSLRFKITDAWQA